MKAWKINPYLGMLLLLSLAAAGCGPKTETTPTALAISTPQLSTLTQSPTSLPATATLVPTVTQPPLPSPTFDPTATHVPAGNVHASTNVISLNLRSGPGTAFSVVAKAEQGAQFAVQGKAPGNNWALVRKGNGQSGWVNLDYLKLEGALEDVPTISIGFARVISGRVIDPAGAPVDGIVFALSKGSDLLANPRTEATTDSSGQFYAYLPKDYSGTWYLGQVGTDCTSRVASPNCTLPGTVTPRPFILKLGGSNPALITFNYLAP